MQKSFDVNDIPLTSGVYIFKRHDTVLYVGKAKNLKVRIKKHIANKSPFVEKADKIDYILTNNESEALLLEANLIKKYLPKYNIRLTDDKKYPYIAVTKNELYPRIFVTRDLTLKNVYLFGPYMSASAIRKSLKILREIFPVRNCRYKLPSKREITPCIEYHIGLCEAPCVNGRVSVEDYRRNVDSIKKVLLGRFDEVIAYLQQKMKDASSDLNFEYASLLRDRIASLHNLKYHFYISGLKEGALDIIGLFAVKKRFYFYILFYRNGKVIESAYYKTESGGAHDEKQALSAFITQYYSSIASKPEKIIVPFVPEDSGEIEEALEVVIFKPDRMFAKLVDMAMKNAREVAFHEEKKRHRKDPVLLEIKEFFGLDDIPERMECVDASQLFGDYRVASLIVFENGKPRKSEYRRYRIKYSKGKDDFAMIYEVTLRRFHRALREKKKLPDLFILDGGKMQLKAALSAKHELGIENVVFVAFAKRFDDFFLENGKRIMLPQRGFALKLMKRIRDEAHRFAISYHRLLRNKESFNDFLDFIPDIGERRKNALLGHFGSLKAVKEADIKDLMHVKGIGRKLAQKLYNVLHED